MSQQANQNGKRFTGKHMLMVMLVFFGVIIAVNMTLVVFANKSWTGLIVKNGYVAGQAFNEEVAAQKELEALGWQGMLDYKQGRFDFQLKRNETPLNGFDVQGILRRPVHEGDDKPLIFEEISDGRYQTVLTPEIGKWELTIKAKGEGRSYKQVYRFIFTVEGKMLNAKVRF